MRTALTLSPFVSISIALLAFTPPTFAQIQLTGAVPYGAEATTDWVRRFDHGIQGHDNAAAVTVDSQGNVLVCGSSLGHYAPFFIYDTTTLKYAADGTLLWERRYHGPGWQSDSAAIAIATNAVDEVYVVANDPGPLGSSDDVVLIKYDAAGQQLWVQRFDDSFFDSVADVVVDPQGDVYVAASSNVTGIADIWLLKYDASGNMLWKRTWQSGVSSDSSVALALDPHGNVDVLGKSSSGSTANADWAVLEYDPAGTQLWTSKLGGTLSKADVPSALAIAPNGDVYATGFLVQTLGNQHHTTARWSDTGTLLWTHTFATPTGSGRSITFDALGRPYVAGDLGLVAYDLVGNVRWQRAFSVIGASSSTASFVAPLSVGRLGVCGAGWFNGPDSQFALEVYDVAGHELDELLLGPTDAAGPTGFAARKNELYFHGSGTNGHDQDMLTAKFTVR